MAKEIELDRGLIARIFLGEDLLEELLKVLGLSESTLTLRRWVKTKIPIHIVGGKDNGAYVLFKAILNAGGNAVLIEEDDKDLRIPVMILTKRIVVKTPSIEKIKSSIMEVSDILSKNKEITAFYKIGDSRWAVEVNDKYFGIYDADTKTLEKMADF